MSFQRIILTPKELRNYKPLFPELKPHPLQSILDQTKASPHVTPSFAFSVAIDLIGLDHTLEYVKGAPSVLNAWVRLLETFGWDSDLSQTDIQISFVLNAIKQNSNATGLEGLKREEHAYGLIKSFAKENVNLETALVRSLILNKALDVPFTLIVHLPTEGNLGSFGVWAAK